MAEYPCAVWLYGFQCRRCTNGLPLLPLTRPLCGLPSRKGRGSRARFRFKRTKGATSNRGWVTRSELSLPKQSLAGVDRHSNPLPSVGEGGSDPRLDRGEEPGEGGLPTRCSAPHSTVMRLPLNGLPNSRSASLVGASGSWPTSYCLPATVPVKVWYLPWTRSPKVKS